MSCNLLALLAIVNKTGPPSAENTIMTLLDQEILREAEDYLANFEMVSPVVIRGGQPDEDALKLLKKAGVNLIVNLRHHSKSSPASASSYSFFRRRGDDDEIEEEQEICQRLGLRFENISLDGVNAPSVADLDRFAALFEHDENKPMYVHCLHGRERTGLMLAIYRIRIESWSVDDAYREMIQRGFDPLRTILSDALFEYAKSKK